MEEKKKLKVWQGIAIIVAVLLLTVAIWGGNTARKISIMEDLRPKIASQNSKSNLSVKIVSEEQSLEKYKKDNIIKIVTENKKENTSKIVILQGEKKKNSEMRGTGTTYEEKDGRKTATTFGGITFSTRMIDDYTGASMMATTMAKIQLVSNMKIFSQKLNEKDCYVIEQRLDNPNAYTTLEESGDGVKKVQLSVEKETGLPVQKVVIYEDRKEEVTTYEYSFDTVTDEDMKAPEGYEEIN